nr:SOSS complex subunit C isoform X1 [Peromyscus maniculatus bairdii]XP_042127156.1 SOSS complex subunit C isoform X1 [Peromyscus maniculatus bairdii]XP_042127157.1 SOSS complex subunit C isoform X1 [Peromyscus maniculatus bairdii]XP_042127158.1 SOSS complex subunit C isoform X1 [Peromyscus maniculatus bairdii]
MAANPSGQGFQNKNRVAILAELDKEKRKLLMQNQSSASHPGASISLSRPSLNKDFRDHAEQQHIAAQQKAALQYPEEKTLREKGWCWLTVQDTVHRVEKSTQQEPEATGRPHLQSSGGQRAGATVFSCTAGQWFCSQQWCIFYLS